MVSGTSGTSINITNETGQILNALKTKRKLPSLEATIQWLFASLDAEGKKEINLITGFLALPPPLINVEEVAKDYSFSAADFHDAIDVVYAKVVDDKITHHLVEKQGISKIDIAAVIDGLVKERREHGLACLGLKLYKKDIIDGVYSKLSPAGADKE